MDYKKQKNFKKAVIRPAACPVEKNKEWERPVPDFRFRRTSVFNLSDRQEDKHGQSCIIFTADEELGRL